MEQIDARGQYMTIIHFISEIDGQYRVACMPNMTEFGQTMYHPVVMRTNESRAVTCPACKKTAVFKYAQDAIDTTARANRGR